MISFPKQEGNRSPWPRVEAQHLCMGAALSRRRNQSPAVNSSHPHGRTAGGDSDCLDLYAPLRSVLTIQSHHSHPGRQGLAGLELPQAVPAPVHEDPEVFAMEMACRLIHRYVCLVVSLLKCCPRTPKPSKAQVGTHSFSKIPILKGICLDMFVKCRKCWFLWRQSLIINEPKVPACSVMSDSSRPHGL